MGYEGNESKRRQAALRCFRNMFVECFELWICPSRGFFTDVVQSLPLSKLRPGNWHAKGDGTIFKNQSLWKTDPTMRNASTIVATSCDFCCTSELECEFCMPVQKEEAYLSWRADLKSFAPSVSAGEIQATFRDHHITTI